jgi:hypothetical protein
MTYLSYPKSKPKTHLFTDVLRVQILWLGTVETYRQLQQILERQNGKSYSLEEVKEIGDGLIGFYSLLIELEAENEGVAGVH